MTKSPENNGAQRIEKHGPEPCSPSNTIAAGSRRTFLHTIKKALFIAAARELIRAGLNKILDTSDCQDEGNVDIEERAEIYEDVEDNDADDDEDVDD